MICFAGTSLPEVGTALLINLSFDPEAGVIASKYVLIWLLTAVVLALSVSPETDGLMIVSNFSYPEELSTANVTKEIAGGRNSAPEFAGGVAELL